MDTFRKEIYLLAQHDATVAAYIALFEQSNMPYSEMLEQLVINLQAEKDCYFKQVIKLLQESPPNPLIKEQSDSAIAKTNNESDEICPGCKGKKYVYFEENDISYRCGECHGTGKLPHVS